MNNIIRIYTASAMAETGAQGGYTAILTFERKGQPVERILSGAEEQTTGARVSLQAIVEALDVLKRACTVEVHTASKYIRKGVDEWLAGWVANDWLTSKGEPVKHTDLWQCLHALRQKHQVRFCWADDSGEQPLIERAQALAETAIAETQTEPTEPPERVLIAGSRRTSENMRLMAQRAVAWALENDKQLVVGDNPQGVDAEVVAECNRLGVKAIVVGISKKPRNHKALDGPCVYKRAQVEGKGAAAYTARDRYMADRCQRGYFIWDGRSTGTKAGFAYMKHELGKDAHLINFGKTFASARAA